MSPWSTKEFFDVFEFLKNYWQHFFLNCFEKKTDIFEKLLDSGMSGGHLECSRKRFLGVSGQEVQVGNPHPCPRGALSQDVPIAFAQIRKHTRLPPLWGLLGGFPGVCRLTGTYVPLDVH